jgi:Cohesin domain
VKKRRLIVGITVGSLAVAAGALLFANAPRVPGIMSQATQAGSASGAPAVAQKLAQLPAREAIGKRRGEPFEPRSWAPVVRPVAQAPVAPPKPVAPPVPYRVAGQVSHDGMNQVVLARDDRVFTVREGDLLDNIYRVQSIKPDAVTLVYLPLNERQQLAVNGLLLDSPSENVALAGASAPQGPGASQARSAAAQEPQPAQLRWEGPKQVHTGTNFDVALKLTSAEPVRALPLQLTYDAKLLEPVAVRPGQLFAEGRFTYRVNPSGSIFVGATVDDAAPADADFLVVTFKPLTLGDAELKLAAAALQGAAGRAISHTAPAAFRTAIVQ